MLRARHADAGGDRHGAVFLEPAGVEHHQILAAVQPGLQLLGQDAGRVGPRLHQLAERLGVGIDVEEQLEPRPDPAIEPAVQQAHVGIAQGGQALGAVRGQTLAIAVDHDGRRLARDAVEDLQLQAGQRQAGGEQGMAAGEDTLLAQIDQRDLATGDQLQPHLSGRGEGDAHAALSAASSTKGGAPSLLE